MISVLAAISSVLLQSHSEHFQSVEAGVLLLDCLALPGFAALLIAFERFWPLWMSGMQAVQVLSHAAIAVNPHVLPWGDWKPLTLWSDPMPRLLAVATWRHATRQKLAEAARSFDITLHDHLVFGPQGWSSMRAVGAL